MGNHIHSSGRGPCAFRVLLAVMVVAVCAPPAVFAQGALTNGGNHAGAISAPGEIDEWTFTASLGDAILLSIGEVLPDGTDPDFRPWIRLRRPDGVEIGSDIGQLAAQIYLTAPLTGTYTVLVRDSTFNRPGSALGEYLLHFVRIPGDLSVPAGDQGGALSNGGNHAGSIHRADLDPWTFTAAQNDAIIVTIGEVLDSEIDPNFRPWIRLYGPNGVLLGSDTGQWAATLSVVAPLSGTYTVVVADSNFNREGSAEGDYLLHLVKVPGTPTVPIDDEGGPMTNGANHYGRIGAQGGMPGLHRADIDPWTFTAAQNDAIIVTIGEVLDSEIDPDFRPWIRLYGPNGALLGSDTGQWAATLSVVAPLSGMYTVVVADSTFNREGLAVGDYVLHLIKTPGALTIPDGDEGGPMTNGANHFGRIGAQGANPGLHRADIDPWTFTAAQNDAIIVTIGEVLDSEIDPDFRPWIRLYGPNGALLGSDSGQWAATLSVTAPLSGTYTVVVADSTFNRQGLAVGDYVLHLIKIPGPLTVPAGDDGGTMVNATNHAGRIGAPGATPTLQRADIDPWTFLGAQGTALTINIAEVLPAGPDPDFRPWIRLYGPTGTLVRSSTGQLTASINLTAPATGLYTVVVADSNFNREGSAVGDYVLSVHGAVETAVLPPTSAGDSYTTPHGTSLVIAAPGVLANDDSNGGGPMSAELVSPVTDGTLTLAANGSFVYTPAAGFVGTATFTYRAHNSAGPGNVAAVSIAVTAQTPTTQADAFTGSRDTALSVPPPGVLGNDASNGGGALTAALVVNPSNGTLSLSANGGFTYTPNPGFAGIDSFGYRAVSSVGPGNPANVTITVETPDAQPPTELYVASVVGNTVTIRWTPPVVGPTPTAYVLEGGVGPGAVQASIVMDAAPVYTFDAPNGAFFIRVHTLAGDQRSAASNEVPLFVNVPATPSAPANLLGLVNGSSLTLAWRNTFGGGAPQSLILDVTGALATSIPLGLTDTFSFAGVPPGTYTLTLRAVNAAGVSPPSNPVTLTFPGACSGAPLPPENFVAYRVGNTINVLWDPAASGPAPSGFVLSVTGTLAASIPTPTRALSGGVGPGSYSLSVVAVNACGTSASSAGQVVVVP
jgi:hypothetical protein